MFYLNSVNNFKYPYLHLLIRCLITQITNWVKIIGIKQQKKTQQEYNPALNSYRFVSNAKFNPLGDIIYKKFELNIKLKTKQSIKISASKINAVLNDLKLNSTSFKTNIMMPQ